MQKRWLKLAALPIAFTLVAAACGDDDDDEGGEDTEETTAEGTAAEGTEGTEGTTAEGDGGSADLEGASITITGPERAEEEAGAIQQALDIFAEENGMEVTYTGDADWEANINTQVEGGNPPDISIFPQPGKLADFARAGDVVALTDDVAASVTENWDESWIAYGNVDGTQYGVPV
jgi:alpha-glucoside transport system substrate-binding protein